jgi:shikimate dehydrogenase
MREKGKTIQAGVIGWPVEHSLSPRLHGYWLKKHGIDGTYVPMAVTPDGFENFLANLCDQGITGVNITVPHKEAALKAVTVVDEKARRIGSVNTIRVEETGELHGSNTDGFGFMENLKEGAPEWTPDLGPVTVLGAGGAARAIVVALMDAGVQELRLVNRTKERARKLAGDTGGPIVVTDWDKRNEALGDTALLVNTTTLGMTGKETLNLDLSSLPPMAVVTDIVYAPLITPLLKQAKELGHLVVDGLGMLLHQARPGFRHWFGVDPKVTDDLRTHVLEGIPK